MILWRGPIMNFVSATKTRVSVCVCVNLESCNSIYFKLRFDCSVPVPSRYFLPAISNEDSSFLYKKVILTQNSWVFVCGQEEFGTKFFCTFYTVECLKFRFWMTVEFYCWTSFKRGECGNKQEKICQKYLVNIIYQKNLPKICQKIGKHHRTFDRIFRNQNRCKNYFCGIHGILLKAERLNSGDWKDRRPEQMKAEGSIERDRKDWKRLKRPKEYVPIAEADGQLVYFVEQIVQFANGRWVGVIVAC